MTPYYGLPMRQTSRCWKHSTETFERIDLGIRAIRIVPGTQGPFAQFDHYGLSDPLPIQLESHGTRQLIRIFPMIAQALQIGGVAVIDELDQSIHPSILPKFDPMVSRPGTKSS